ncbi:MAG TPA: Ig-like domain repeat protein [Terriglobia bacterium]|nr:Ig-like domain repeat protein [Terriglobia bacterium]
MGEYKDAPSFSPLSAFVGPLLFQLLTVGVLGLSTCLGAGASPASGSAPGVSAQAVNIPALVKQPVNDAQRVVLKGNVHPLARRENDIGLAPDSLPMSRMLLVLKRSPQQEAALAGLLVRQQEKSSSDYHHWLTPQQFGQEFGPSDSDLQAVTDWLTSQGFEINRMGNGRAVIEFSGSAGLMRQVFRTEIHQYAVNGKSYWANSSDPQIPAALAPVVAGIASLNNFPRKALNRPAGLFSRSKKTGEITPLYTIVCPQGYTCSAPAYYALGPTDFATIYNVLPLWNAGTDGAGQTIAIVADSNINPQDVANFRSMFGLPPKPVNVILDGPDPGIIPGPETEADADTEWAGAIAKNATIDLVVSEDTEATAGFDLSALYIVDNNLAPVLSESFGVCESALGSVGNAFENAMWEQAAAEGITVLVASGDEGPATCDNPGYENAANNGLAVSGIASTPFNVAVGGTDFGNPSTYFNSTSNSTTQSSAKSYVPEITWNDSCGRSGLATDCPSVSSVGQDLAAGGGGASNCALKDASGNCSSGYAKPPWQTGTGVPADSVRDVPDVSLFSGDGFDAAFYVVCSSDEVDFAGAGPGSCSEDISNLDFLGVGGTSLSAPAFAGIMALVNQKTGERQGNANFVLYPLAAAAAQNGNDCASNTSAVGKSSCVLYDTVNGKNASGTTITPGNNSVACVAGSPNCKAPTGYPYGILVNPAGSSNPAWTTATGYDLATGLGSVNAANMVNNWSSVSFHSSGTTLGLMPTTLTHGQQVTATISVTSSAGTPTGDVELMGNPVTAANPSGSSNVGIETFTLSSGGTVSGSTNMLPGGTYNVFAHYAGDGTNGSSDSTPPISVTVNPESSQPQLRFVTFDTFTGAITGTSAAPPAVYGSAFYLLRVDILNSAGKQCAPLTSGGVQLQPTSGCPTGSVTLTANGSPLNDFSGSNSATLNSQGYLEDQPIELSPGSYSLAASYSGDASFQPSSANVSFSISHAPTTLAASLLGQEGQSNETIQYGFPANFNAIVGTNSLGAEPGGTFTFFVDGTQIGSPASVLNGSAYNPTLIPPAYAWAEGLSGTEFLNVGTHTLSATYSGDVNYQSATSTAVNLTVTKYQPNVVVGPNPSAVELGQQTILLAWVNGAFGGSAPTGMVTFYDAVTAISGTVTYTTSGTALVASLPYTPTTAGMHDIKATYSGDFNFVSASGSATLTVQIPDFQMSSGSIVVPSPGKSGSTSVYVSPVDGWTGTVNLSCAVLTTTTIVSAQDAPTCSLNPAPVVVGANQVSSTLTVNTTAPSLVPPAPLEGPPARPWPFGFWFGLLGWLSLAVFALVRKNRDPRVQATFRRAFSALVVSVLLGVALWGSCGGGGGSSGGGGGGGNTVTKSGTSTGTYTVTVTGTSGSLQHQTVVTLIVQ